MVRVPGKAIAVYGNLFGYRRKRFEGLAYIVETHAAKIGMLSSVLVLRALWGFVLLMLNPCYARHCVFYHLSANDTSYQATIYPYTCTPIFKPSQLSSTDY